MINTTERPLYTFCWNQGNKNLPETAHVFHFAEDWFWTSFVRIWAKPIEIKENRAELNEWMTFLHPSSLEGEIEGFLDFFHFFDQNVEKYLVINRAVKIMQIMSFQKNLDKKFSSSISPSIHHHHSNGLGKGAFVCLACLELIWSRFSRLFYFTLNRSVISTFFCDAPFPVR